METIVENLGVLLGDYYQVWRRYVFLKEIGRVYYNLEKVGYVFLESLVKRTVEKWCWKIGVFKEYYVIFLKIE